MASLSFECVSKRFGDVSIVEDFTLDVEDGELLVLVGGSGSGKSTILRLVAGLEAVTRGSIRIAGRDITALPPRERDVAMVFQDYALYPHLSVRDNLTLGLRLRHIARTEIDRRIQWAGALLGLDALLDRKPKQLSGGQRQRVAMGRAMVREPLVFLFDEPLSNLDAGLRARMRIEIGSLQRRLRTTTVFVTHDQVEALTLGDRIVVLANGRIQQLGPPVEVYRNPANRFVAGFIGTPPMNFVDGTVAVADGRQTFIAEGVRLDLPALGMPDRRGDGPITLGVRPEDLTVVAGRDMSGHASLGHTTTGHLAGRVVLVERLGGTSHVHIDVGPHRLLASVSGERPLQLGELLEVRVATDRLHLFDAEGRAIRP
ncbi:MAG: sn-glycerol-3-phosphate ABC transporter ATP-binding protein UgpC [Gemmatimonadaceae bacterium]